MPVRYLRVAHTLDIPFVFHRIDMSESLVGLATPAMRTLESVSAGACASLARTGDRNHSGMPQWPACTSEKRAVISTPRARSNGTRPRKFGELWRIVRRRPGRLA